MEPDTVLATVADPDGRPVVLTAAGWRHILTNHREMGPHRDAILLTVSAPDHRRPDPAPGASASTAGGRGRAAGPSSS